MNDHRNRLTLSGFLPMLLLAIAALGLATPANADRNDPFGELAKDLNLKRSKNTGKGMPSIRGPFPDTDGLLFLGQLTNAELGVSRLVFTGASFLSDIWGWTDTPDPENPDHTEDYVIVGTSSGVAFVRVTDPEKPEFLGLVPTTNPDTLRNFWWDIKTYNNHAYWTTEVNNAGVGIFDLTQLRDLVASPPETTLDGLTHYYNGDDGDYIRAHNISINEDSGFAYLTGVSMADPDFTDDGLLILDLSDPLAPAEAGEIIDIDSHDAQVVNYKGPDTDYENREIAFVFNGGDLEVGIYDVTDKGGIVEIATTDHPGASFTHQGWLTEDHRILIVGDEEDELFGVSDPRNPNLPDTARTYFFDVQDLDAPQYLGFFDSPAASIDHNLFVKGDKVYQANYTAGVRVLDISGLNVDLSETPDVATVTEIAHMDTEPRLPNRNMNHNINIFIGPWGVFPYFDSGTIAASDGINGLILMKLE